MPGSMCPKVTVEILLEHILHEVEQLEETAHLTNLVSKLADHIKSIPSLEAQLTPTPLTKLEQAYAIYDSMPDAQRIEVIKMIMSQLNMTKAGASSYYAQARDRLAELVD